MNLNDMLVNTVDKMPEKIFYREGEASVTYGQFHQRVCMAANALQALGVGYQEKVAVIAPNSAAYAEIIFACAKAGVIAELINWRLSKEKLCQILSESDAKVVFIGFSCSGVIPYLKEYMSRSVKFFLIGGGDGTIPTYEELVALQPDTFRDVISDGADIAIQMYTSGTTGKEKGVMLSHESIVLKCLLLQRELPYAPDDIFLGALPFFHVAVIGLFSTICAGATYVAGVPTPEALAATIVRERITRITLVPSILGLLVRYLEAHPMDMSSLKLISYGAAPMSPELLLKCKKIFDCEYAQGYGMTETMSTTVMLLPQHHEDVKHLSSVGKPMLGTYLRIVDNDGRVCTVGESGEILIRQPGLMVGYYNNPEKTAESLRDGWYYTGDIGYLDEEGFLHLVDRRNNMVISGGENIFPKEVSDCIQKYLPEEIAEIAIIGVPDSHWGETLMAAVVRAEGSTVTQEDILSVCKEHLDAFKRPKYIYFVDSIPRNDSGKVSKPGMLLLHESRQAGQTS